MSRSDSSTARSAHRRIRSFVVRRARMNELHKRAIERLSPQFVVDLPNVDTEVRAGEERRDERGDIRSVFDAFSPEQCHGKILEVGFGMGYATAEIARARPNMCIVGSEVYPPGVGKLLAEIERLDLRNVRIVRHDAVDVLTCGIRDGELDAVHVFFPDPWPKKRHHKRRLIQPAFLELAAQRLASDGYLYITTDWEDYAEHIASLLEESESFENAAPLPEDNRASIPREWRPLTSFERKGLAKGHRVREFYYRRRPRAD